MNTGNENKLVYTVNEMADKLGISSPVAYELVHRKDFPALRLSERRIVIPVQALNEWLNRQAGGSLE